MAKKFTKDMTIKEALELNKDAEAVLMGFGMHCFHCPMSIMETLEEAGSVHGADIDLMLQKLNELNISFEIVEHEPALTTEQADSFIEGIEGVRTKTMFLTNKKKT